MQIGGIAWWLLPGMFGFGAAMGLCLSILTTRWLIKPARGDWGAEFFYILFGLIGTAVVMPVGGLVAVALTFAVHHLGWDAPLPYLAGTGLVFLTLLAGWVLWTKFKPSSP